VLRSSGPSVEDLERTERWNAWLKSYFVEVGKAIGYPAYQGRTEGLETLSSRMTPPMMASFTCMWLRLQIWS
jgi:hypothetical protein